MPATSEVKLLITSQDRVGDPGEVLPKIQSETVDSAVEERWLPVVGFELWYEVSDLGAVRRSRDRFGRQIKKRLRWAPSKFDYPKVSLLGQPRPVHLLVADAFLGPRPAGYEVDHGDGDRNNPRLTNLDVVTHEENVSRAAARKNPGRPPQRGWRPDEVPWDSRVHGAAALILLALSALGCTPQAPIQPPDITPTDCRALCAPRPVYSWTANSCVCNGPCTDDGEKTAAGAQ